MTTTEKHCPTCHCGRRAPVQRTRDVRGPGSIEWEEHLLAWSGYNARYPGQSAERIAERGGFDYAELLEFLGGEPRTWRPIDAKKQAR